MDDCIILSKLIKNCFGFSSLIVGVKLKVILLRGLILFKFMHKSTLAYTVASP